jgi:hypothetical protein
MSNHERDVPRVPERFLTGEASLQEYLEFLHSIDPKRIAIDDYLKLADLVEELAKALNIPGA